MGDGRSRGGTDTIQIMAHFAGRRVDRREVSIPKEIFLKDGPTEEQELRPQPRRSRRMSDLNSVRVQRLVDVVITRLFHAVELNIIFHTE